VKTTKQPITDRRKFITLMAQSVGLSALGGMVWTGYIEEAKAAPLLLRPPGARPEKDFISMCIRCGQCVSACPFDTLYLAKPGDQKPIGTPYFIPREIPCYMCTDIPCVPVCPTGALDEELVSVIEDGRRKLDIEKARMGLAVVDMESCIAYWGIQCDACYRACPVLDSAIHLEYRRNERTGKHAYLIPIVNSEACTGCGLCERACVTEKPAIFVRPHAIAQGDIGKHYIKGWDSADERRIDAIKGLEPTVTKRSDQAPQDYLNSGGLFDD
jgi:ferredoxin-type protein NapG